MKDENGNITFDQDEQAKVDEIVQERLGREKAKYQGFDDYKGIEEELKALGYQGTPSEIRAAIKNQREEVQRQQELQELQQQAKNEGTSPELLQEIRELKKELSEIKGERQAQKQADEQKKAAADAWAKQESDFRDTYPDVDLKVLDKDEDFLEYVEGKKGTLVELYDRYLKYAEKHNIEVAKKVMSKSQRTTSSGKPGVGGDVGSYNLTAEQKAMVDKFNKSLPANRQISYKDYAEKLKEYN